MRRLAAILMADAVRFTDRAARDERAALTELAACMELLERTTSLNGGRVVKTMGDGLMAEFGSAVASVSAAAAMQERLAERARDVGDALAFRIGVHVGDVMVAGGDLLGDGVNLAARLEAAADPGGVLLSGRVHDDVRGKIDLAFEDAGERALKGIPGPVRVWRIAGMAAPAAPPAPALPEKPSVAVLPFANLSTDPEQAFFADGLTEDIITALSRVPWIFVIARNSSFIYKGAAVDVRKVGRDLGVAYVLEGSVRRAGERLRVTGQLADAATGAQIWADRFDGAVAEVFDFQDEVTDAVVRAIAPQIQRTEIDRARAKPPENLTAYDRYHQGLAALHRADSLEAARRLDLAIEAAPGFAKAIGLRAWCATLHFAWLGGSGYDAQKALGESLASQALQIAPDDPETMAYAGYSMSFFGSEVERGLALVRAAVEQCPSFYWARTSLGMLEALHGPDPEGAIEIAESAMRLSPRDPLNFRNRVTISHAYRRLGDYERQLEHALAGRAINPEIAVIAINVITALYHLGRLDETREEGRRLNAWKPDFNVETFLHHHKGFRADFDYIGNVRPALRYALGLDDTPERT